jgi:hypothetical protein
MSANALLPSSSIVDSCRTKRDYVFSVGYFVELLLLQVAGQQIQGRNRSPYAERPSSSAGKDESHARLVRRRKQTGLLFEEVVHARI